MTSPAPAADSLFRSALEVVRTYPIDIETKPAFTLPATRPRAAVAVKGEVEGLADDAWATAQALREGRLSLAEVVAGAAARIDAHSSRLGAFEYIADLREAAQSLPASGPLYGLPLSVKDVIDVEGMPTSGSSVALRRRVAARDATAVARLRAAGALISGKAVTHEFALGVTTPQSHSPWDEARVPGGSSGGSAISLVTGMSMLSLGTDTRASIRVPAALNGLVGFRPTTGLVPVDGWLPLSWSMDVLAPMARSVRDIALMMDVLTDSTAFVSALPGSLDGLRVGYSDAWLSGCEPGVRSCFEAAVAVVEAAGGSIERGNAIGEDELQLSNMAGMVLSRVEAAQSHLEAGTDFAACTPEVRDQLVEAAQVLGTDYVRALRLRSVLYERFLRLFDTADLLIMPTSKVVAPPRGEAERYLLVLSENCIHWSLVGFPAVSLHAGLSEGLPVGVQLVGRPGEDARLIAAAYALERALPEPPRWPI